MRNDIKRKGELDAIEGRCKIQVNEAVSELKRKNPELVDIFKREGVEVRDSIFETFELNEISIFTKMHSKFTHLGLREKQLVAAINAYIDMYDTDYDMCPPFELYRLNYGFGKTNRIKSRFIAMRCKKADASFLTDTLISLLHSKTLPSIYTIIPHQSIFTLGENVFRRHLRSHIRLEEATKATAFRDVTDEAMFSDRRRFIIRNLESASLFYQIDPSEIPDKWWFLTTNDNKHREEELDAMCKEIVDYQQLVPNRGYTITKEGTASS